MFIKVDCQMREKGLRELKGVRLATYLNLALHMNREGIAFPSLTTIAQETGYNQRNIQKALRQLEHLGYIEPLDLSTRSNAYRVNHYVSMRREEQFEGVANHAEEDVKKTTLSRYKEEDKEENKEQRNNSSYNISSLGGKSCNQDAQKTTPDFCSRDNAREIWDKVKEELQKEVSPANYKTWVKDTKGLGFVDGAIVVGAPNDFVVEWLEKRFQHLLVKKASEVLGSETQVKVMKSQED